jgi:phage shock protein PspC (stress-responsive transcriptional regulator)
MWRPFWQAGSRARPDRAAGPLLHRGSSGNDEVMPSLTTTRSTVGQRGLVRPRRGKLVAGVAAGLARRYDLSPSLVRILFLVSMLLPGPQIIAYIALWIIMPKEE